MWCMPVLHLQEDVPWEGSMHYPNTRPCSIRLKCLVVMHPCGGRIFSAVNKDRLILLTIWNGGLSWKEEKYNPECVHFSRKIGSEERPRKMHVQRHSCRPLKQHFQIGAPGKKTRRVSFFPLSKWARSKCAFEKKRDASRFFPIWLLKWPHLGLVFSYVGPFEEPFFCKKKTTSRFKAQASHISRIESERYLCGVVG